jgi:SpoVK/Ycf46/Vps4 family AAA+-type ATPase
LFTRALANLPCVLFFDEFDSIAGRREDEPRSENRRTVNQLLTSLERYRSYRDLVSTGRHHGFESLEEARVLLAPDFSGDIVDVVSQPMQLQFPAGGGSREHTLASWPLRKSPYCASRRTAISVAVMTAGA